MTDSPIDTFRSVIELWRTRAMCAAAIGATSGQVSKWWQRDWIPSEWWKPVLETEEVRQAGITAGKFVEFADRARTAEQA